MFDELKCITIERPYKGFSSTCMREFVTLDVIYKQGWWITEIFGNIAVIVKHNHRKRPSFSLLCKPIKMQNATPKAIRLIKKIQIKQWNLYKDYLLYGTMNSRKK